MTDEHVATDEHEDEPQRKPFTQFLVEHRRGALHAELTEQLAELVNAVVDHSRGGKLTLTIAVRPGEKGTDTLVVVDDVKLAAPQAARGASIAYPDSTGSLHRSDPRQPELPLRRVPADADEPRRVEHA